MSDTSGGISGLAVGTVAAGLLLAVSAVRNQSPADTLRQVIGRPPSGRSIGTALGSVASGVRGVAVGAAVADAGGDVAGVLGDGGRLVTAARKYLGVRYVYGGVKPNALDCSGLVIRSLRDIGTPDVPRFTTVTFGGWAKSKGAIRVGPDQFRIGDVVCRPGHMGIAVSADRMIHAPHAGTVVKEAAIYNKSTWWGWRLFK